MKVFKNITICIMISLIVQISGFFYLNNYFLASNTAVKSQKVPDQSKKTSVPKISVPNNADSINVSYNGSYVSYFLNDELYVVNTITGSSVNVSSYDGIKISFYKWLPDRNRMLTAQTENSSLHLSYYDADEAEKSNITDILMNRSTSKVKDIEAAPLPNVIYIKVSNGIKYDSIYRVNIMKSIKKISTKTKNIGNIKVTPLEDKMVYEDLTNSKVYKTGISNALKFNGSVKSCLLQIDNNDEVYIGEVNSNNNIDKIYFGALKDDTSSWNTFQMSTQVSKDSLFVTAGGKIYINDNLKASVTELQSGKETAYKGTFLQLYDDGIASISQGILVKTSFN